METLRQVWIQQFSLGDADAPIRWRTAGALPPSSPLSGSPYDPDARHATQRSTRGVGYKGHLTETRDDEAPHLVTDVTTTVATTADNTVTAAIQGRPAARGVPPRAPPVETGDVTADHLLTSQADHQCTLPGPIRDHSSWQARAGQGFATAQFGIDRERECATCPQGHTSAIWKPTTDGGGHAIITIRFAHADCRECPVRAHCVSSARPRALAIRPQAAYEARQEARARQHTALFEEQYAKRAGVEGTIAQGVRLGDLRRSRYRGLAKTPPPPCRARRRAQPPAAGGVARRTPARADADRRLRAARTSAGRASRTAWVRPQHLDSRAFRVAGRAVVPPVLRAAAG